MFKRAAYTSVSVFALAKFAKYCNQRASISESILASTAIRTFATSQHATTDKQNVADRMKIIKTTRDGNCLFRSISLAIFQSEDKHLDLRREAVHWIQNNLETEIEQGLPLKYTLVDCLKDEELSDRIQDYLKDLRKEGNWGDFNCVVALSRSLKPETNFNIALTKQIGLQTRIESIVEVKSPSSMSERTIWLAYDLPSSHYDLIILSEK